MTPEQWKQVERIYNEALEYQPEERSEFVAKTCGADSELRREVESLIEANAGEFLERPAAEVAAKVVARSILASETQSVRSGTKLGPYEIADRLGKGGMGEVYRATDTRLRRTVAVKVLLDGVAIDTQRRERFEREAMAISRLNHPHICTLHDVGEQDGIYYLVMEFVEGETLASRLKNGRLPLSQILEYVVQIAGALDEAHLHGVVHRDLKPDNIMITRSGVKLLDFGLAKLKSDAVAVSGMPDLRTQDMPMTARGTILGTLQYMAPEQLEGKEADARTDIFAFGTIIYEMFTGNKAFEGSSQAALIAAIMKQEPQPMAEHQPTPGRLDYIVLKCLSKNPDDRWQTVRDLTLEVRKLTSTHDHFRPVFGRPRFDRPFILGIGVLFIVAAQVIKTHLSGDPWIVGWFVSLLLVSALFSVVMVSFHGQNQKHIAFATLLVIAALSAGAVWWRYIDIRHFLSDPLNVQRPMALCYGHYGFIPYVSLLGSWIIFMTYVTYSHTRAESNKENQIPILVTFCFLVVYLFACRLVWENVDNKALERLRQFPSIEVNCSSLPPG